MLMTHQCPVPHHHNINQQDETFKPTRTQSVTLSTFIFIGWLLLELWMSHRPYYRERRTKNATSGVSVCLFPPKKKTFIFRFNFVAILKIINLFISHGFIHSHHYT
jgi:hypothetical protein